MIIETLLLLLVVLGAVLFFPKSAAGTTNSIDGKFDGLISTAAKKYGLPFEVVKAMIWRESNFNPNALGDTHLQGGAIGLMQIRPPALADYNRANGTSYAHAKMYDPRLNIEVGAWYLGQLVKRNGLTAGMEMFNVGEAGYKKGIRNTKYLASILERSKSYA